MKIDAHQHFWKYDSVAYDWIDEDMSIIAKDFLPKDLSPVLKRNNIDGCIVVQARQSEEETNFLIELAKENDFIKGVVGWVDLRDLNIDERLHYFSEFKIVKGFRHVLQGEADIDFMLHPEFLRGIAALGKYNFVYDLLIFPKHLANAAKLVHLFPEISFVLDHIAKPDIKKGHPGSWKEDIKLLSSYQNVYCKLSGMVTEGDWNNTKPELFKKYIDHVINCFGIDRVMFGSDWPVCQVAASYERVVEIVEENTKHFSMTEKEKLWGENCAGVYKI